MATNIISGCDIVGPIPWNWKTYCHKGAKIRKILSLNLITSKHHECSESGSVAKGHLPVLLSLKPDMNLVWAENLGPRTIKHPSICTPTITHNGSSPGPPYVHKYKRLWPQRVQPGTPETARKAMAREDMTRKGTARQDTTIKAMVRMARITPLWPGHSNPMALHIVKK